MYQQPVTNAERYGELGKLFKYGAIYNSTKNNARKRNIPFDLTRAEFDRLVMRSNGRCLVSGLPFQHSPQFARNPFAPSIDRKDSSKGYTRSNCRIVCVMVNIAMNEWGEDLLVHLCKAVSQKRLDRKIETKLKIWAVRIDEIKTKHAQAADDRLDAFKKDNEFLTAVDFIGRKGLALPSGPLTTLTKKYCERQTIPWFTAPVPIRQRADLSWYYSDRIFFPESALAECVRITQERHQQTFISGSNGR